MCSLLNGHEVHDPLEMMRFIRSTLASGPFAERDALSYFSEWRAHQFLHEIGVDKSRTVIIDLDVAEPVWRRFLYFLLSILYLG